MPSTTISRPLDPGEAFFFLSDHVSCMNFVVFAQRSATLDMARLQAELNRLQQENGLLQVRIEWTQQQGLRFESTEPLTTIQLQCHTTDAENWQSWIEGELSAPFATGAAPLLRCLYLEIDNAEATSPRSVLALTFHHSIADGRAGTALLRILLKRLANTPRTEADSPSLSALPVLPAMADVFPPAYRWNENPEAAKALRGTLIGDYRRHGAPAAIPWLASQAAGRTPRFIRLQLPAHVTQRLLTRARENNTTLHGLLCAAQLIAQWQQQTDAAPTAYFLSCPVDMRVFLEPAQPVRPTGLYVSLISNTFQISAETDVWGLARSIMTQTRLQLARGEGHLLYHLYGLTGAPVLPEYFESFKTKALASLPNTMVSNIGAVTAVVDDPATESISFALCPMPYQTLFTAASSYNNTLILNIGFDAERLAPSLAQTLVQAMQNVMLAA
jgi:NRPS condensation-like uncharacterized protein